MPTQSRSEMRHALLQRMATFTVRLDVMLRSLPPSLAKKKLQDQLGRSGSSIGANYAESGPAESLNDFLHKLSLALKEAEETSFWLQCVKTEHPDNAEAEALWNECHEFVKILQSSITTTKRNAIS